MPRTLAPFVLCVFTSWSPACAALAPFLFPVLLVAFLNSVLVTLRQRRIWWRDTFYRLDALRDGNVR